MTCSGGSCKCRCPSDQFGQRRAPKPGRRQVRGQAAVLVQRARQQHPGASGKAVWRRLAVLNHIVVISA